MKIRLISGRPGHRIVAERLQPPPREPDEDVSWAAVAGYEVTPKAKGTGDGDNESHDSGEWHPDEEFDEHDPEVPSLEYVREGNFSRCVTICKKKGPLCTSVCRRITQGMDTQAVIEYIWINEHEDDVHWGTCPKNNLHVKTTCFYDGDSSEETTVSIVVSASHCHGDRSAATTVPTVIAASPAETSPHDETEGSRFIDAADPDVALNDVAMPHCLKREVIAPVASLPK